MTQLFFGFATQTVIAETSASAQAVSETAIVGVSLAEAAIHIQAVSSIVLVGASLLEGDTNVQAVLETVLIGTSLAEGRYFCESSTGAQFVPYVPTSRMDIVAQRIFVTTRLDSIFLQ